MTCIVDRPVLSRTALLQTSQSLAHQKGSPIFLQTSLFRPIPVSVSLFRPICFTLHSAERFISIQLLSGLGCCGHLDERVQNGTRRQYFNSETIYFNSSCDAERDGTLG